MLLLLLKMMHKCIVRCLTVHFCSGPHLLACSHGLVYTGSNEYSYTSTLLARYAVLIKRWHVPPGELDNVCSLQGIQCLVCQTRVARHRGMIPHGNKSAPFCFTMRASFHKVYRASFSMLDYLLRRLHTGLVSAYVYIGPCRPCVCYT